MKRDLGVLEWRLLDEARRAVLVTTDEAGRPRPTPCCYVADPRPAAGLVLYTPIDEKPKALLDPRLLPRLVDIAGRPDVAVLVDRWSEDWLELGWLLLRGTATIVPPDDPASAAERGPAIAGLRARYRQYASHDLEARPLIRIEVRTWSSWHAAPDAGRDRGAGIGEDPG